MIRNAPSLSSVAGRAGAFLLTVAAGLVAFSGSAMADDAFLAKVDEAVNKWKTLDYTYDIVTETKGDADKAKLKLRMRMKDAGKHNTQIVEISAPADMKGTKVLTISPTEMYIYLPAMRKVRRIASHVTEAGFLGTALSQKDLTLTRYGDKYKVEKTEEKGDRTIMLLVAKGDAAPYPKIRMTVATKQLLPTAFEYMNEQGKVIKTEKRSQYRCEKDYCTPGVQEVDDVANGKKTTLSLKDYKINPNLDDSIFSKRSLLK